VDTVAGNTTLPLAVEGKTVLQLNADQSSGFMGKVGIGTSLPTNVLSVYGIAQFPQDIDAEVRNDAGTGRAVLSVRNTNNDFGQLVIAGPGYAVNPGTAVVQSNNGIVLGTDYTVATGGTHAITFQTGGYFSAPTMTVTAGGPGMVGIGTTTPNATVDVRGELRVGSTGAACSQSNIGSLQFVDPTTGLKICDGAKWGSATKVKKTEQVITDSVNPNAMGPSYPVTITQSGWPGGQNLAVSTLGVHDFCVLDATQLTSTASPGNSGCTIIGGSPGTIWTLLDTSTTGEVNCSMSCYDLN